MGQKQASILTSLTELPLVHTQVLPSTVLLENLYLIPHVDEVVGKVHGLSKEHHAHTHFTLYRGGPEYRRLLENNTAFYG